MISVFQFRTRTDKVVTIEDLDAHAADEIVRAWLTGETGPLVFESHPHIRHDLADITELWLTR